jgi:hypothetical protein
MQYKSYCIKILHAFDIMNVGVFFYSWLNIINFKLKLNLERGGNCEGREYYVGIATHKFTTILSSKCGIFHVGIYTHYILLRSAYGTPD